MSEVYYCLPAPGEVVEAPHCETVSERSLRIAHVVLVTPGRCGLYETTRELVAAERELGADARMYDPAPTKYHPAGGEDRGAKIERDRQWLEGADLIVDHSGCDGCTDAIQVPHILIPHGRPKHSFLGEMHGEAPVYSYQYRLNRTPKYKAVVTFWPEHIGYLEVMFPDKPIHAIPAPVDLKAWTPDGPKHDFGGKGGRHNVVITDPWRDDGDMFDVVNAVALAARQLHRLRLHIYGNDAKAHGRGWGAILNQLASEDILGEVGGKVANIGDVYRAADLLVTPHDIHTRTVREAWACNLGVYRMLHPAPIRSVADRIVERLEGDTKELLMSHREWAETWCDPLCSAKQFLSIAKGVLAWR